MRLTKFNPETGQYVIIETPKTFSQLMAQRKAVIQKLGELEDRAEGEWQYEQLDEYKFYKVTCPYCDAYYMGNYDAYNDPEDFNYCPNCGARMKGADDEQR